ncbi:oligopeptide transport system substrate-binding protein [Lentibacillus halodurans]|uniref:Oligopeptide transport system substrate-binding protein n=1 Tax=Lentibacillus halodurans TaxID=237679 RepID=A0A1I0X727_9BACI|nr:peptide ABC transporter substrate-binding protein [Lentibacillus halodurans]SFA96852.1 oligopeptide transport system substrate-binding protein [Lentibacillus halodurans]
MNWKKWSLLLALVFAMGIFLAACGGDDSSGEGEDASDDTGQSNEGEDSGEPALAEDQSLTVNIKTEPPSLHPGKATDTTSNAVLTQVFEGLTRVDQDGEPQPAMASDIEVSDDGLTYTFTIRDGVEWSNGDPITAQDFADSWKWVLNPDSPDTDYAYQMYPIKGAEAAKTGEGSLDDVGITVEDEKTLVVELENPTPYFLELTAFYTYFPFNQDVAESNDEWAADAGEDYVTNGPFLLEEWAHKDQVVLKKNPDYWDAENVHLETITMEMVDDENTAKNMYDQGELDWIGDPTDSVPLAAIPQMKQDGTLNISPMAGTYYYSFNTEEEPFTNANIRKAFALSLNREAIVQNITKGEQRPGMALVPSAIWEENEEGYFEDGDTEKAKEYLETGLEEMGLDELPTIQLSYNTDEGHAAIAQAAQDMWKENLGVDVELNNEEWNVYLDSMSEGNYQVGRMGWLGDFLDPINFLEIFETVGGNNYTNWEDEEYASLLEQSRSEEDEAARKELLREAEQIFMDAMPIAPVYFYSNVYAHKDYVKNVTVGNLGTIQYKWGYIEEH